MKAIRLFLFIAVGHGILLVEAPYCSNDQRGKHGKEAICSNCSGSTTASEMCVHWSEEILAK